MKGSQNKWGNVKMITFDEIIQTLKWMREAWKEMLDTENMKVQRKHFTNVKYCKRKCGLTPKV